MIRSRRTSFTFLGCLLLVSVMLMMLWDRSSAATEIAESPDFELVTQEEIEDVILKPSVNYDHFLRISEPGPIVPGLKQDYIPQGLAHYPDNNWLLISYYHQHGGPGLLSAVDLADGQMVKAMLLYNSDGTPYTEHAAGVAVSRDHAWIASGRSVYQLKLEHIDQAGHMDPVIFTDKIRTETLGGWLTIADDVLWVGEFARYDFPTDGSHHLVNRNGQQHYAWVSGYRLNSEDTLDQTRLDPVSNVVIPDYLLSIPDEIQGMTVVGDRMILSKSYGISNDSDLLVHQLNVDDEPEHANVEKFGGYTVPLWFLDDLNLTNSIMMPPMSEGIYEVEGSVYVLFESAATAYLNSDYPLDRIYAVNTEALVSTPPLPSTEPGALLITEVVVNSGANDAYRYIELYNNTGESIDLADQRIYYYWQSQFDKPWEYGVDKFVIHSAGRAENTLIEPYSTKVVWYLSDSGKNVDDFNAHYGSSLTGNELVYITGSGFSHSTQRFFAAVGPKGDKVHDRYSFVRYNGDAGNERCTQGVNCDFSAGESVVYFLPETFDLESREMERRVPESLRQVPTPGVLLPDQVPPAAN